MKMVLDVDVEPQAFRARFNRGGISVPTTCDGLLSSTVYQFRSEDVVVVYCPAEKRIDLGRRDYCKKVKKSAGEW